jgi:chromosome partitioning protein
MKTIAVLNQKGGVGKTTTVTNIAAALATIGAKVVVIDFDPQAHLTIHLGLEPQKIESGSYKVLTQSAGFDGEILMVRPNLWLLPANIDLVGAESELVSVVGRETILREAMEASEEKFDYCLIDCAPSLGLLTLNALAAAEEVLIPLQPHFLALQGFGKLLQTIELVNRRINPDLRVKGVLLCMFDSRASLPNEVKADIEQFLNNARGTNSAWADAQMIPVYIRRNIKLAEAPSYGKTIFEYEPSCNGAEDYRKVAEYLHAQYQEAFTPEPEESAPQIELASQDAGDGSLENAPTDEMQEQPETQQSQPAEPAYIDINQVESSADTDSFGQSESPDMQTQPVDNEQSYENPPIEIREIRSQDSQAPAEFTETTTDQNQPNFDQQQY